MRVARYIRERQQHICYNKNCIFQIRSKHSSKFVFISNYLVSVPKCRHRLGLFHVSLWVQWPRMPEVDGYGATVEWWLAGENWRTRKNLASVLLRPSRISLEDTRDRTRISAVKIQRLCTGNIEVTENKQQLFAQVGALFVTRCAFTWWESPKHLIVAVNYVCFKKQLFWFYFRGSVEADI